MHNHYGELGLEVIAFPSNDFYQESKTNSEIKQWCEQNFGNEIKLMAKTHVNGPETNSVFRWLRTNSDRYDPDTGMSDKIQWNYGKFLISITTGKVVTYLGPQERPDKLIPDIENLLNQ